MAPADALTLAEQLLARRRLKEAMVYFDLAESRGAEQKRCAAGRWMVHMLRGDFVAAWAESDAIRETGGADPNCLWRGEPLKGKRVLVRCLHGFGDAVQFFRYAPKLNAIAETVVWQVPPALVNVAGYFAAVERVITWEQERASSPDWEVQIESMELPSIFRTRMEELPITTNYLKLPDKLIASVAAQMGWEGAPRVGLVWAAGEWNPARSIPLEQLCPVLQVSGCEFWNLQGGAERRSSGELPKWTRSLRDANPCNHGIVELAAVIARLDLVITVDTLAAHLAGAMGVPAWVMLQFEADWRWMVNRDDSPWYPSLWLCRQRSPGDWESVAEAVEGALVNWVGRGAERLVA